MPHSCDSILRVSELSGSLGIYCYTPGGQVRNAMCALLIAELDTTYAPLVLVRARGKPSEPSLAAIGGAEPAALTADHVDQFFKVRQSPKRRQPQSHGCGVSSRSVVCCAVLVSQ